MAAPVPEIHAVVTPAPAAPVVVASAATAPVVVARTVTQPTPVLVTPKPAPAHVAAAATSPPAKAKLVNAIVTVTGGIYNNAHVEKVEPDGLTVSYTPARGGMAITKIDFDVLPDEWQRKYGYDPEKKAAYEKKQKVDAAWWRDQMIANDEAAIAKRQAQQKADADAEALVKKENEKPAAGVATATPNQPQSNASQPPAQH